MFCGGVIRCGERYIRATIVDGDIYDWVSHLHCECLTRLLDMYDYDDGITTDAFETYIQEYVVEHHKNDPDWNYMDIERSAKMIFDELKKTHK